LFTALANEFASRQVMVDQFPMLTRHGIPDTDLTIHSHFLSYLVALAHPLGYSGVVECPVLAPPGSRWAKLGEVRPDVIWFDKADNAPVAAFEFERFERGGESKLRAKVENLSIAHLRSDRRLQLAVLIYWVRSGVAPRAVKEVSARYHTSFVRRGCRCPPPGVRCASSSARGGRSRADWWSATFCQWNRNQVFVALLTEKLGF
jgi:hypothetical protein